MSDARDGFDDLYDATATVECCEGGSFRGRSEMESYWRPRLARAVTGPFEIDALFPDADGVRSIVGRRRARASVSASRVRQNKSHSLRAYQSGGLMRLGRRPAGGFTLWLRSNCARRTDIRTYGRSFRSEGPSSCGRPLTGRRIYMEALQRLGGGNIAAKKVHHSLLPSELSYKVNSCSSSAYLICSFVWNKIVIGRRKSCDGKF